ncbi:uncharacterized protein LOC128253141 isoform X3 [Drosophila gunungcola]|uniref:uncharacterized protein LOC128253141 isoform X3 n=1 Tax=Drosophila gunungcola TaxID=103775 RepID=UPI0022E7C21F|nr:uncharacterized protein LOC128253141 isoform X3 [Drosophila gunungcola]
MTSKKCAVLGLLFFVGLCWARVEPREVLLVIACPHLPRQARDECFALSDNVREQHRQLDLAEIFPGDYTLKVHVMHELFNYWTLLDALPHLQGQTRLLGARTEWIIWCQHNTRVASLRGLLEQLRRQDPGELSFHGHALYDSEATIIHHFSNYKDPQWFPYPMLSAGVVFTGVLLRRLAEVVASNTQNITLRSDFSIDASHELARFIYDNVSPDPHAGTPVSARIILKSASYICPTFASMRAPEIPNRGPRCMLHAKPEEPSAGLTATSRHLKERCVHDRIAHIFRNQNLCEIPQGTHNNHRTHLGSRRPEQEVLQRCGRRRHTDHQHWDTERPEWSLCQDNGYLTVIPQGYRSTNGHSLAHAR